jgi:hypothetical protein
VPTIAIVNGVRIVMYWNDHAPAHFHALLAEHRAVIEIDGLVVGGYLPKHKLRSILKWAASRQDALHAAWRNTQALRPSGTIE